LQVGLPLNDVATEENHKDKVCFLVNRRVAWEIRGATASLYLSGSYVTPKGWIIRKRLVLSKWVENKSNGCYTKIKQVRENVIPVS